MSKHRTFEDIYNLWIRSEKRSKFYIKQSEDCLNEILDKIKPDNSSGSNQYVLYDNDDPFSKTPRIRKCIVYYDRFYKRYTESYSSIEYDDDYIQEYRNDIIEYLMEEDLRLYYGEKYRKWKRLKGTRLDTIVYKYMWEIILEKLKKIKNPPKIFEISLCGNIHYISYDKSYSFDKFKLVNKSDMDLIEFN